MSFDFELQSSICSSASKYRPSPLQQRNLASVHNDISYWFALFQFIVEIQVW